MSSGGLTGFCFLRGGRRGIPDGWLVICRGTSFGGRGLLSSGGEGGKLTMLGLVFRPGSDLDSGFITSSSTRLGSASTLPNEPIFFNADCGGGKLFPGAPGGGGNCGPEPPAGTLIKIGFSLPPSSCGSGKVLYGRFGACFKWGKLLKSGTVGVPGAALGEFPAGGPGGLLGGGGPEGPRGGGLGLT